MFKDLIEIKIFTYETSSSLKKMFMFNKVFNISLKIHIKSMFNIFHDCLSGIYIVDSNITEARTIKELKSIEYGMWTNIC